MKSDNCIKIEFLSKSCNEGFARVAIAALASQSDPTLEEISEIKTAVSEAVTNSVVHAYPLGDGMITIKVKLYVTGVVIEVADTGVGISDFEKAREPFYTTKPNEERSGMGFTVMESFMDSVTLQNNGKSGLVVKMEKIFKNVHENAVGI